MRTLKSNPTGDSQLLRSAGEAGDTVRDLRAVDAPLPAAAERSSVPTVSRQEFKDFIIAERNHARNCSTLPLTLCLWISFLFVLFNHSKITPVSKLRRCVHMTTTNIRVAQPLPNGGFGPAAGLSNLTSLDGVWNWITTGFLPAMGGSTNHPGFVCTFNQVIGQIQLRQSRRGLGACQVDGPLATYYRGECRGDAVLADSFGSRPASTESDPAFLPASGMVGISEENQQKFFAWLDPRTLTSAQDRSLQLARERWCDDSTERLDVQVALFNAEVHAFTHLVASFTFEQGGLARSDIKVSPFFGAIYASAASTVADAVWVVLNAVFLFITVQEAFDRKGSRLERCFGSLWMVTDWLTLLSCAAVLTFSVIWLQHLSNLEKSVGSLGPRAPPPVPTVLSSNATAALIYQGQLTNVIEDLEALIFFKVYERLSLFWYVMLLLGRFFRGLSGQPRIFIVGLTLERSASDILHFFIILAAVFENFALGGCVLFGTDLADWAHRSTLAVMFGQGDFATMYATAPVSATIWLLGFLVSVVFLVTNMVVAILFCHYLEARRVAGLATSGILEQLRINFREMCWRSAYHYRTVHRFIYGRLNISLQQLMPQLPSEPRRQGAVPYDELLEAVSEGMDEAVAREMDTTDAAYIQPHQPFPWNPVSVDLLLKCGLDQATAEHLLRKCECCINGRMPDALPAERLFFEFQNTMHDSYNDLDSIAEELHTWLNDRVVDLANIEPRQKKLAALSENIQPQAWPDVGPSTIPLAPLPALGEGYENEPLPQEELLKQVGDRLLELELDHPTDAGPDGGDAGDQLLELELDPPPAAGQDGGDVDPTEPQPTSTSPSQASPLALPEAPPES